MASFWRGDYCNDERATADGYRRCDMHPDHKGFHTDGEVFW